MKTKLLPNWLWLLLAGYFMLWTLAPLLAPSYPLDVIEGIVWGSQWQLGYYKHPPLSSWLLYTFYALFGAVGPYLLSQLTIIFTIYLIYRFGCLLLDRSHAAAGAVLVLGIIYYSLPTLEFNHNVAQLPIWIGLIYTFYLALKRQQWRYWLLFGVLAGVGMLVKYSVAILLLSMVFYSFLLPQRKYWLSLKPWLAVFIAALIFLPNVVWLWQHDWLPFTYMQDRAVDAESKSGRLSALEFLVTQLINHIPLAIFLLSAKINPVKARISAEHQFLYFFAFAPALLLVGASLLIGFGVRDMWGAPMWNLSGLVVAAMLLPEKDTHQRRRLFQALAVWLAVVSLLMVSKIEFAGQIKNKPSRMDWPQRQIAEQVIGQWQRLSACRLDNIAGDYWLAGLAAVPLKPLPAVLINGPLQYSPWIKPSRVEQQGIVLLWQGGDDKAAAPELVEQLGLTTKFNIYQGRWQFNWQKVPQHEPLVINWRAYVPPGCVK